VEKWEKGSNRSRTIQQLLEIMLTTKSSLVILYVTLFRTIGGLHKVKAFFPVFFNGSPIKLQSKDKWSLLLMSKPSKPIIINESPKALVSRGMEAFRQGDIDGSIFFFDAADEKTEGKLNPYLWQRGLSYYYADRFQEGSKQFKTDVAVNPMDVEEIVWDIACLNRMNCGKTPKDQMMSLPVGKRDRRKIMGTVYALFREDSTEMDLAMVGQQGNIADEFYSLLYLGLYCESKCEESKAAHYIKAAIATDYATGPGKQDYMTSVARVHSRLRGW